MKTDYPNVHWATAEHPAGPKGKGTIDDGLAKLAQRTKTVDDVIDAVQTAGKGVITP